MCGCRLIARWRRFDRVALLRSSRKKKRKPSDHKRAKSSHSNLTTRRRINYEILTGHAQQRLDLSQAQSGTLCASRRHGRVEKPLLVARPRTVRKASRRSFAALRDKVGSAEQSRFKPLQRSFGSAEGTRF
jgi:hypothetical protein